MSFIKTTKEYINNRPRIKKMVGVISDLIFYAITLLVSSGIFGLGDFLYNFVFVALVILIHKKLHHTKKRILFYLFLILIFSVGGIRFLGDKFFIGQLASIVPIALFEIFFPIKKKHEDKLN